MQAFFDESERSNGVFAVCGYGFFKTPAKRLSKQWARMLGDRTPFHMKEVVHRRGAFKGITPAERDILVKEAAAIITKRAQVSVVVLCYLKELNTLLRPRHVVGLRHAYGFCSYMAMIGLGKWIRDAHPSERIAYYFESGHQAEGDLNRFLGTLDGSPDFRDATRMKSYTFIDKGDAAPLQAADMLAWEAAKWWHETIVENIRPSRQSLQALALAESVHMIALLLTGPPLRQAMREFWEIYRESDADPEKVALQFRRGRDY